MALADLDSKPNPQVFFIELLCGCGGFHIGLSF